jgi:hypothetical protein
MPHIAEQHSVKAPHALLSVCGCGHSLREWADREQRREAQADNLARRDRLHDSSGHDSTPDFMVPPFATKSGRRRGSAPRLRFDLLKKPPLNASGSADNQLGSPAITKSKPLAIGYPSEYPACGNRLPAYKAQFCHRNSTGFELGKEVEGQVAEAEIVIVL